MCLLPYAGVPQELVEKIYFDASWRRGNRVVGECGEWVDLRGEKLRLVDDVVVHAYAAGAVFAEEVQLIIS